MLPALLLALTPQPIDLDRVGLDRARVLSGRVVVATFVVAKPVYTWPDRRGGFVTVVGAADHAGERAERGAVLRGDRLAAVDEGKRIHVVGVLRVIDHGPYAVDRGAGPELNDSTPPATTEPVLDSEAAT